ncbi:hypothetical protein ABFT80_25110 [Mesorhizobium sp. SB112]|uniref:hypothetical protein n=1 Tax=Mesorhizobium sp. SB112 TaxID=3151853 RepID=UPI0032661607
MARLALFDALPDFGRPPSHRIEAAEVPVRPRLKVNTPAQPDIPGIVAAEVTRATAELEERLRGEHEAALLAEREAHAETLRQAEKTFADDAAALLTQRMVEMETHITDIVTSSAATLLTKFLSDDLQKRSIEMLAASIRTAFADGKAIGMRVQGPQSLYDALARAMPERAGSIDFTEADTLDLTVTIEGKLFETRLGEWSDAMSEFLR